MFDIIIRNGKKESYIKLNGNKLVGFNALNGEVSPLTEEEVNTINLLKLSEDKSYLGQQDDYDIYVDNVSKLKHYFKDGKEDFETTWEHNGEDGLIYKGDLSNKDDIKKFTMKDVVILITKNIFKGLAIGSIIGLGIHAIITDIKLQPNESTMNICAEYNDETTTPQKEIIDTYSLNYYAPVTALQIEKYVEENDNLTAEEKAIYDNKKLLEDIVPYYENTNMNILIPLKFDGLQTEYFYAMPEEDGNFTAAYYDPLIPNRIFVNTYVDITQPNKILEYLNNKSKDFYDRKAHEHIHLLQSSYEYMYITEASAEIISCEYDDKCFIASYLEPVKNTKILMEIIGPEPIWKLNFSGNDTDLVNTISANLDEEKASKLISLLKENPSETKIENLDLNITDLLSQMYINMYGEDMRTNPFIDCLLGNGEMHNRYYFNSDKILKESPYVRQEIFNYWHVYAVSNTVNPNVLEGIQSPSSEELYILFKNDIAVDNICDITGNFLANNEVKFYYHGEEIDFDSINSEKYKNVPITYQGDVFLEGNEVNYYPTIYESFPDQRISQEEFLNNK